MEQKTPTTMDEKTAIAVMANDIHHMKTSLDRLERTLSEQAKLNVTRIEFETYKKEIAREFVEHKNTMKAGDDDREKRLRDVEKDVTKILTWGSGAVVLLGIAQFLIGKFL